MRRKKIAAHLLFEKHKGVLGLDEGLDRFKDRFLQSLLLYNKSVHSSYLTLMTKTPKLGGYVGAITLHDQSLAMLDPEGNMFGDVVLSQGFVLGVRADLGYDRSKILNKVFVTRGIIGLNHRLLRYREQGVNYVVWRNKYYCTANSPTQDNYEINNQKAVEFAVAAIQHGLLPVVQIKVSNNGAHTQATASVALSMILEDFFVRLDIAQVDPSMIVLQTNFITPGKLGVESKSPSDIAKTTLETLGSVCPATLGGIIFVCDGLRPGFARIYLEHFNKSKKRVKWDIKVSFNFGRGIHDATLGVWKGKEDQIDDAQVSLLQNSRLDWQANQ